MLRRTELLPNLTEGVDLTLEDVQAHLRGWLADTRATVESLRAMGREAEERQTHLESPKAVREYIEFFVEFLGRAAAELDQMATELAAGTERRHLDALRQLASNAAVEQRRCLQFRDKWINRPLPYEDVRPLLTRISSDTRDQLADYRHLTSAAERLEALAGFRSPPREEDGRMDRRALFNKILRRDPGDGRS
jgi:hypothetical protein